MSRLFALIKWVGWWGMWILLTLPLAIFVLLPAPSFLRSDGFSRQPGAATAELQRADTSTRVWLARPSEFGQTNSNELYASWQIPPGKPDNGVFKPERYYLDDNAKHPILCRRVHIAAAEPTIRVYNASTHDCTYPLKGKRYQDLLEQLASTPRCVELISAQDCAKSKLP